jgi:DNA gyrase/topoisomerase IV subunit B
MQIMLFLYMQTLEIKVPDDKSQQVKDLLRGMGIAVKVKKESKTPNADTIAAMEELKAGKGKKFNNVDDLFNSI